MKRCLGLLMASMFVAVPMLMAQESNPEHVEVGVFADYFRLNSNAAPVANFFGVGGRAGFNVNSNAQIEAEMAYDFERNYTSTFKNGITTATVNSSFRTLHGFFGPKFQTGSGAFRVFVTGKVGFDNFSVNHQSAGSGFVNTVGLTNGATYFAVYPGGGFEGFAGPIGLRAEVGDDIYFNGGARNNLRVTFGPQFRF
jgi:outer membrane protein with beta-barrel domain